MRCIAFLILLSLTFQHAAATDRGIWPQWRGPLGTGEGPDGDPPSEWDEREGIRWKTPLPGLGHSSPVLWRDRVFLTTAVPFGDALEPQPDTAPGAHDNLLVTYRVRLILLAIDRASGKILWQKVLRETLPHAGGHYTASLASASAVVSSEHVFAFFGSYGLYCLDHDGNLKWQRDFGRMQSKHGHGEGASPALFEDTLIVNWDHEGQSFVAALDASNGKTRWERARDEVTSWSTPIVVQYQGQTQAIVCGTDRVRAYQMHDGKVIWECGGLSANIVATPVAGHGMLFAGSSYERRALIAIRLSGAVGDITGSDKVVWSRIRGTPYVPSPLLYDEHLYFLRHYQGILSRVEARTGRETAGPFRLGSIRDVYASPVAAAGKVYITDRSGTTVVLQHRPPEVLAVNRLNDRFSASMALAGREILLRGERHLYCLARE